MTVSADHLPAVSKRLDALFTATRSEAAALGAEALMVVDAAAAATAGGKRLRALFCLTGWQAVAEADGTGRTPGPDVVAAATALEVFQAAALVHDDLIDNSDTRRGRPAAHRALQHLHEQAGWAGDAAAFGRAGALLVGDLLLGLSDDVFEEALRHGGPRAEAARTQYASMRREVTVGQFLDIAEESAYIGVPDDQHAGRALRVASVKSARYSVQQPLLIGARLAGADERQADALSSFGLPVGLAFQMRDDVLGVFGEPALTGKPAGDDLREGKRTVLIAYAREGTGSAGRARIDALLGDPELTADEITELRRIIVDSGALARVEAFITDRSRAADAALDGASLGEAATTQLRLLALAATDRTA